MSQRSGWPTRGRYSPRRGANRLPENLRRRVLRRYPSCQLSLPGICTGASTEVDHVIDAAEGGPDTEFLPDGTVQLVGVCSPCHTRKSAQRSRERAGGARGERMLREPERRPNHRESR